LIGGKEGDRGKGRVMIQSLYAHMSKGNKKKREKFGDRYWGISWKAEIGVMLL
jgi:hypothetical protein